MIREEKLDSINLFIFTDLILIVEENSRKVLRRVPINDKYFVRQ